MVQKLREILLTKYIGSILVALFCWQFVAALIEAVVRTLFWFISNQRGQPVYGSSHAPFPWNNLVFSAVTGGLYLLLAYFLARWLYPASPLPSTLADDEVEPSPDRA